MTADIPFAVPAYATVHRNIIPLRSIQRMRSFADWAIGYRDPPPDGQGEPDWSVNIRTLTLQGLIGSPETLLKEVWSTAIPKICREVLGPELLRNQRAIGALAANHPVAGDRHHEAIARGPGLLQVPDVAGVHEIEAAVAEHHRTARRLLGGDAPATGIGDQDRIAGLHDGAIGPGSRAAPR